MYAERPAPAGLACPWTRTVSTPTVQRVVPDGCTDLMWKPATGSVFVAGPDTQAQLATVSPGTLAAETGYADQAHLAREVRALAGVSLSQLIRP